MAQGLPVQGGQEQGGQLVRRRSGCERMGEWKPAAAAAPICPAAATAWPCCPSGRMCAPWTPQPVPQVRPSREPLVLQDSWQLHREVRAGCAGWAARGTQGGERCTQAGGRAVQRPGRRGAHQGCRAPFASTQVFMQLDLPLSQHRPAAQRVAPWELHDTQLEPSVLHTLLVLPCDTG